MKIFVAMCNHPIRDTFFTPAAVAKMRELGEVSFTSELRLEPGVLAQQIGDADVLFTGWGSPCVTEEVLAAVPGLKYHAHTGGSVAGYVSEAEYRRGVCVLSGNDVYARSVAEGCLCFTLDALRNTYVYAREMKDGGYLPALHSTRGLLGKKVALVGYGAVAAYYARLLCALDVDLYIVSSHMDEADCHRIGAKLIGMEEAFSTCDVVSLHMALTERTRGCISGELLHCMKDGALLVNTARAELTDEQALYRELGTGRIRAVLDVFHTEPLPGDSPLRSMPNVLLMPHVAGPTTDLREYIVLRLLDDIAALERGEDCPDRISYESAGRMTVK